MLKPLDCPYCGFDSGVPSPLWRNASLVECCVCHRIVVIVIKDDIVYLSPIDWSVRLGASEG